MKTLLLSLLLALAFLNLPHDAHAWDDCACENSCWGDLAIEGRVAYYRPSSKKVKEIYGNGWADYQIELSKGFCQNWRAWIGVSGFHKGGRSLGGHDKTSIRLIPVTLGIKYLFNAAPCTDLYVGAGACYSYLRMRDHSPFVQEKVGKSRMGGLVQIGAYYSFNEHFFADVFVDYLYQKFRFSDSHHYSSYVERHDVDMSGFKVGAGLGYRF